MKALTVQQPWAWAIVHGGKDVENRTQAWGYRGELLIHAGGRIDVRGMTSHLVNHAMRARRRETRMDDEPVLHRGAILGLVDLIGAHTAHEGCCDSDWAEQAYPEHGGSTRHDVVHLELADPRPLEQPIPCRGQLGLWTPANDVLDQVRDQLEVRW